MNRTVILDGDRGGRCLILLMHILKVLGVTRIFSNILNVNRDVELYLTGLSPVFVTDLGDNGTSLSGAAPVGWYHM